MTSLRRELIHGAMRDVLSREPSNSADSVVTDPPYALTGETGQTMPGRYADNPRVSAGGFMGLAWDKELPTVDDWREAYRALKPGAHLVAFGGTRTYHRLATIIEDAGFVIRDMLGWVYLSGFPKSLDVSKAIDKRRDWSALRAFHGKVKTAREALGISQSEAARRIGMIAADARLGGGGFMWFETGMRLPTGEQYPRLKSALGLDDSCDGAFEAAEREVIGQHAGVPGGLVGKRFSNHDRAITASTSALAVEWEGWGTALKPCWEPIVLARKPFKGMTVADCVLTHGTAALNVDGCRIPYASANDADLNSRAMKRDVMDDSYSGGWSGGPVGFDGATSLGRWPGNIIAAPGCFAPDTQRVFDLGAWFAKQEARYNAHDPYHRGVLSGLWPVPKPDGSEKDAGLGDRTRGKWDKSRKEGLPGGDNPRNRGAAEKRLNVHPTVKPVALMRFLARLVTPKGGTLIEPFTGSGTTLVAAIQEGFGYVAAEREAEYVEIAKARAAHALNEWEGVPLAPTGAPLPLFDTAQTGGAA